MNTRQKITLFFSIICYCSMSLAMREQKKDLSELHEQLEGQEQTDFHQLEDQDAFVAQFFRDEKEKKEEEQTKKRKRVEFETQDGKEVFLKEKLAKYAKTLTYALNESVVSINDEENRNPFPAASIAFFRFKQLLKVEKKVKEQSYDSPERCTLKLAEDVKEFLRRGFSFEELVNLAKASDYFDTDCFLPVIDYMSDYLKEKSRSVRYDFNQLRENNRIEETLKEKIKKVVVGKYPKSK